MKGGFAAGEKKRNAMGRIINSSKNVKQEPWNSPDLAGLRRAYLLDTQCLSI